jgi:hypothetical protein
MQNAIFSSASESFLVDHIVHVGPVVEIAAEKQKNDKTHYFRLTTLQGAAYCRFKNEEAARRSRGALGAMLGTAKPYLFRTKGDSIDLSSIVSFGKIIELKNGSDGEKFGLPIRLKAIDQRASTVWITFKTDESGQNVRKALWAALMSYYVPESSVSGTTFPGKTADPAEETAAEAEVVFADE